MNVTASGLRPTVFVFAALLLGSTPAFAQTFPTGPVRVMQTPYAHAYGLGVRAPAPNYFGPLAAQRWTGGPNGPLYGAYVEFVPDASGQKARVKTDYNGQTCYLAADYELPGYIPTLFPTQYDLMWDCTMQTVSWFDLTRIDSLNHAISKEIGNSTCGMTFVQNLSGPGYDDAKLDCTWTGDAVHVLAETETVMPNEYVSQGLGVVYGPFPVVRHTPISASIAPTSQTFGDADLYVRFDAPPTLTDWDCRGYSTGSHESCSLTVPPTSVTSYYIMVWGYSNYEEYELRTTRLAPQ